MFKGEQFARWSGRSDDNDPDAYQMTITGTDSNGSAAEMMDLDPAEHPFENQVDDFLEDGWNWIDLSKLRSIASRVLKGSPYDGSDSGE